jgi:hypothetical protein
MGIWNYILSFLVYLDTMILSLTNVDGNFYCDKVSWWISN